MDIRIKNWIGYALIAALIIGSIASLLYVRAFSRSIEPSSFRSFTVSGEGTAVAIPDVAMFMFEVITEGDTNLAALSQANIQKTNAAIAFVKTKGVEDKDIKTQGYRVDPRYQYFDCGPRLFGAEVQACPPPEIVGYTVRNTVSVKVRNFEEMGGVLSGVVDNGANSVSGIQFTVDDPTGVENEARTEAITKAKEKADAIAQAGNFRLGRLLSISEGGGSTPVFRQQAYAEDAATGGSSAAPPVPAIEPGSQDFQIMMTLTYEIR